jgi:hypothetical protein
VAADGLGHLAAAPVRDRRVAAFLGVLALYLLIEGLPIRGAYAAVTACHPASSSVCQNLANNFNTGSYVFQAGIVAALLQVTAALIGAFAGAPVLARELETGTFRYAWTQGFGRWRWAAAKLALLAVAAVAVAFSLMFSWYYQPFFASGDQTPLGSTVFDLRGIAFAAWTLAAFTIGAVAGVLIRRVVPAMAATMVAWAGLAFVTGTYVRQHYEAPLVTANPNVPGSAWVISQWWQAGRPVRAQPGSPGGGREGVEPRRVPRPWLVPGRQRQPGTVPRPARLHADDELSAGQPVLDVPVHRRRLAVRALPAAHRRDRMAGPPPRRLRRGLRRPALRAATPAGGRRGQPGREP